VKLTPADVDETVILSVERAARGDRGAYAEAVLKSGKATGMEVFPGISMNLDVRFGKPCLTGTRMDVATVVLIAAGETVANVASEYQLTIEQVRAALAYAAQDAAHLPPAVRHAP
jgi:uncharacterized protein (DUF433 family)